MQDRDTELDKMKNTMVNQNKTKWKHVVVENQEEKVSIIPARCTQACDLERKNWQTLTVEDRRQLEEDILSLTETIEAQKQLLSQSDQAWQDKYDALKEKNALTAHDLEMSIRYWSSECRALEGMRHEWRDTEKRLELENQVLVQKQQSQELKIQQLTDENKILEEVCLQFEKKNQDFFGKKMQDRDTELDKMKNKKKWFIFW
ncbi:hypothetical protein EYF80_031446 [Liparis tanakae]|uniref:Uncharacterized protein n=1 Tax=Liparis tanakae TaxID=230148 RepID=A0A4Z2H0F0_9TELE|nr:hypothetical protein EYF80_031446 [Liparis tanakae]